MVRWYRCSKRDDLSLSRAPRSSCVTDSSGTLLRAGTHIRPTRQRTVSDDRPFDRILPFLLHFRVPPSRLHSIWPDDLLVACSDHQHMLDLLNY